ncbi:hypothetical protein FJZ28_01260 [Candidatus Peregrinibacteria bacterium]|nr:hypothetical protein [Candidatus Peregrinibacteria bacterium]
MTSSRPSAASLETSADTPLSCRRILASSTKAQRVWIGPQSAKSLSAEDSKAYVLAHTIMCHIAVRAPAAHASGHPGGPLSAFTFSYFLSKRRDPGRDQPLRISAGHLSLLSYTLQWLFGREGKDARLASPASIIEAFRTPKGLPGHVEAGIGDIPFGTGPLGKGVSQALGVAFGLKHRRLPGTVDVLMADGDSQEGQIMEAFRLAPVLKTSNLIVHGDFNDIQLSGVPSQTMATDMASIADAAGWNVVEVQNGNDPGQVVAALDAADALQNSDHPTFVCYYTTMGHGVKLMEDGSTSGKKNWHGTPMKKEEAEQAIALLPDLDAAIKSYESFRSEEKKRFTKSQRVVTDITLPWEAASLKKNGYTRTVTTEKNAARKDFGSVHLASLMRADERIVVLHADLAGSGGFDDVEKLFPSRVINVGVAEANMAMMASGMRQAGLLPVTYTFAAFGTNEARASARLIDINCGHTRCSVLHDCTHAGLSVGEDGETHQERHYLNIPFDHTQVWMPADANQAAAMAEKGMELIAEGHTSVFIFMPRSGSNAVLAAKGKPFYDSSYAFDGRMDMLRGSGGFTDQATLIASGATLEPALAAADALLHAKERVHVRLLNASCIRPIDASAILHAALETAHLIVVEDHSSEGGIASQVADVIADFSIPCSLRRLGVNHYFPSAPSHDLMFLAGIDRDSILDAVEDELRVEICGGEDALVTFIHEFVHNVRHSRFRKSCTEFIERLTGEKGYLEALRTAWANREFPVERLPDSATLLSRLQDLL